MTMTTTTTSTTGQPDQALTRDQRVALRRSLEELAALEASRVKPVSADGSMSLDDHDVGLRSEVHDALGKIADGTYGDCETCQSPIPVARLEAVPYARRCLACQEREENDWHHVQRLVAGARARTGDGI
jgi:DnaK suppressor protein